MELTAENTAIVVDSTADFPEAPERFANWRVVPLYVRFGDESFRDYVELSPEQFYARLRTAPQTPSTFDRSDGARRRESRPVLPCLPSGRSLHCRAGPSTGALASRHVGTARPTSRDLEVLSPWRR